MIIILFIMGILLVILATAAFVSVLHEIRHENRCWNDIKRRRPKW